jgi:tetratricopeptide (TPR) repeat protein
MRIPRQLLISALTGLLAIASVVLPARAQTQTPKTAGEPSQSQQTVPPPRLPVPMTATGEPSIIKIKPGVPPQQPSGVVMSCDEQIKNWFASDPNGSLANYNLGWCYLNSKKFDDAVAAFQKAIQSIPEWIKEREEKDIAHLPKLSKERQEELQRNASPSLARFAIGWTYQQAERFNEAVAAYRQIQSTPTVVDEARYQTAMVYLFQGNREAAAEQVAKLEERFQRRLDIESKLYVPDLIPPEESVSNGAPIIPMTSKTRPIILYREKAKYTEEARQAKIQGTVVLQVIFRSDGALVIHRVIRYLPFGLTMTAVLAGSRIQFTPAMENGSPISSKGTLEFTFNLY